MDPKLCMHAMKATTEQMGWQWKQLLASTMERGIWNQHHVSVSEISALSSLNSVSATIGLYSIVSHLLEYELSYPLHSTSIMHYNFCASCM